VASQCNSMGFGQELKNLVLTSVGSLGANDFQQGMKQNHQLTMEYIAGLLRRTVNHNGPVKRHEIDPWLRTDAVTEIRALLYPSSSARAPDDNCIPQYRWGFRH
jgi:hypothetical protein